MWQGSFLTSRVNSIFSARRCQPECHSSHMHDLGNLYIYLYMQPGSHHPQHSPRQKFNPFHSVVIQYLCPAIIHVSLSVTELKNPPSAAGDGATCKFGMEVPSSSVLIRSKGKDKRQIYPLPTLTAYSVAFYLSISSTFRYWHMSSHGVPPLRWSEYGRRSCGNNEVATQPDP
jgi:hypothetical protein